MLPFPDLGHRLSAILKVPPRCGRGDLQLDGHMQGKLNDAEAWWQRARAEAIAGFGPTGGHLAVIANGLAEVLRTAGGDRFVQAEALYRESIEITERAYGKQDMRSAHARQILGQYLSDAGRHKEALKELATAVATKRAVLGRGHVDYAQVQLLVVAMPPSCQLQLNINLLL
jgi:tetratricopeptide (TPR) repeat protein